MSKEYEQLYTKAVNDNKLVNLTPTQYLFKEVGERFIGRLLSIDSFISKKFGNTQMVYTFETDDGLKNIYGSAALDRVLNNEAAKGRLYCITFAGREALGEGRSYKDFDIVTFPEEVE